MAQGQQVRFASIYSRGLWKSGGSLSGHGSRLDTTESIRDKITELIENAEVASILDLGCGDLTWISQVEAVAERRVKYYGVDVVPALVAHNQRIFPWFNGEACDLEAFTKVVNFQADLVILKDVLPHHCAGTAAQILKLVNHGQWKYLLVTSHPAAINQKRSGITGPMWVPFNVETTKEIDGEVLDRLHRPGGGEYQLWTRRSGSTPSM